MKRRPGIKGIVFDREVYPSYNKTEANLKNLSFSVKKGNAWGYWGNGLGKTTLAAPDAA